MNTPAYNQSMKVRKLVALGLMTALSFAVVALMRIPIAPSAPFLDFEAKDVIIAIAGFIYGPLSAFMVSVVVSLLEMVTISETGFIGFFMNVVSTVAFVCPAAYLYKKNREMKTAVWGLVLGVFLMTAVMLLWNYFITPLYMGVPRDVIAGMLLPVFLPFNLIKGGLNTGLTLLLYKPLVTAMRKSRMLPVDSGEPKGAKQLFRPGYLLIGGFILASCVAAVLVWQGVF